MARIVVLISGRGSNLAAILARQDAEGLGGGCVVAVLSNKPDAPGLAHARQREIPVEIVEHRGFATRAAFDDALAERIDRYEPDLVVLAGFMRILTGPFTQRYAGRLINTHPSLLPKYRGVDAVGQALAAGDHPVGPARAAGGRETGCTVHYVTEGVDEGPVIAQSRVPIEPGDDHAALEARVLAAEHLLLPRVIAELCARRGAPAPSPASAEP
jgi:phosphoribosylglycinamide formyltransferase-1